MYYKKRRKISKFLIPISTLIILITIFFSINLYNNDKTIIISHRGASGEEIEHTFSAYDLAIAYGSSYIEQDLVTSKDNVLYVSHDNNSERLTGVNKNYSDMTSEEISELKVDNGENIHTLEDVFTRYGKKTNYVIETKQRNQVFELVKLIKKYDLENHVIIQSFHLADLLESHTYLQQAQYMFLSDNKNNEEYHKALVSEAIDIICLNKTNNLNESTISEVQNKNKKIYFYTINSFDDMKYAKDLGVDGLFTDYTAKALYIFK